MASDYVSAKTTRLCKNASMQDTELYLLWGDEVEVLAAGDPVKVKGRGATGFVKQSDLGGKALLEIYFIDVGQGDGALIVLPNRRHIMIDGGNPRSDQPTGKNAADFVDWKFAKDYGKDQIVIDALIASHCDYDHFGGLSDLLDAAQNAELDTTKPPKLGAFFHAGLSWWKTATGDRTLGAEEANEFIDLLDDLPSLQAAVAAKKLHGPWGTFIAKVVAANPTSAQRLSHKTGTLPGNWGNVTIKVLGPIEETTPSGKPGLSDFNTASQNTNGHSILLRLDYGHARIMMTGDLNKRSHTNILKTIPHAEPACDVAKGCHHGSDDVSLPFLQAMNAAATVISSGDSEGYAHPRPTVVAASAVTGHVTKNGTTLVTPLVYSTELARSVKLTVNPQNRSLNVGGVVYGLVNVRTDGKQILCATRNEAKKTWDIETFDTRFGT